MARWKKENGSLLYRFEWSQKWTSDNVNGCNDSHCKCLFDNLAHHQRMWKWFILIRPHPSHAYLFRSKQESVQNKCYILSNFSSLKMGFHANIRVIVVNSTLQHTFPTNKRSAIKRIIELRIRTFHFFVHLPELKTMFAVYDCVVILSLFFFVFAFQLISVFFSMCLSWSSVVDSLRYFINIVILVRLFVYFQHSKQQRFNLFNLSLYRIKQNETLLDARNFREKKRREKEEKKERMKEKNVRNAYEMNFSSRHFKWNIFYGLFIFAERYQPKSKHTKQ